MGGAGSGRRRTGSKNHDLCRLDLAQIRGTLPLSSGVSGSITWNNSRSRATSYFSATDEGLQISDHPDESRSSSRQNIEFASSTTSFGGRRLWFKCPKCHSRCRVLFKASQWLCGRCSSIHYPTQSMSQNDRCLDKLAKSKRLISERLNGTDRCYPEKPKGMHWKTFNDAQRRIEQLEAVMDRIVDTWMLSRSSN